MGSPEVNKITFPNGFISDSHYIYSPGESHQMPRTEREIAHEVEISQDFWILETPITQEAWISLMGYNPSSNIAMDHPVEQVNYFMTQIFTNQLNTCLDKHKYKCRLPTEAEWEYASRAGQNNTTSYWDDINNLAWTDSQTHKVKQRQPNNWGIYDMLGNVAEWVHDWYAA